MCAYPNQDQPHPIAGSAYSSTKRAVLALTETINVEECIHDILMTPRMNLPYLFELETAKRPLT
jgi:hypothetical protein